MPGPKDMQGLRRRADYYPGRAMLHVGRVLPNGGEMPLVPEQSLHYRVPQPDPRAYCESPRRRRPASNQRPRVLDTRHRFELNRPSSKAVLFIFLLRFAANDILLTTVGRTSFVFDYLFALFCNSNDTNFARLVLRW